MRDGGATPEDTATDEAAERSGGRFARLRRHRLLTSAVALALLAAGTAVTLVLADSGEDRPCRRIPASTRALAEDPAAATRALDPGDDLSRYPAVRDLLSPDDLCADGAEALGKVIEAATRASGPGAPHTMGQARGAYAVVAALSWADIPDGMAPSVARVLADYVVDEARYLSPSSFATSPVAPPESAEPDERGRSRYGRFLAPGEAHVDFEYHDPVADAEPEPDHLVAELAGNPEAFAILYDAERAYFAHYLERLTQEGGDPAARSSATVWPDNDLEDIAQRVGALMQHRAEHTKEGAIPDLAAFDGAVRRHTRGAYEAAPRQLTTRPPMGDIADRPVSGPLRGDLADGRHQLLTVLDAWAEDRGVPEGRARVLRQLVDDAYLRGVWLRVL
ncbi:hypothetical protein RKD49_000986 [Streptomyces glaucescens]